MLRRLKISIYYTLFIICIIIFVVILLLSTAIFIIISAIELFIRLFLWYPVWLFTGKNVNLNLYITYVIDKCFDIEARITKWLKHNTKQL